MAKTYNKKTITKQLYKASSIKASKASGGAQWRLPRLDCIISYIMIYSPCKAQEGVIMMKVESCIKDYLIELEIRQYADNTIQKYKLQLNMFNKWCKENDITDMEDVRAPHIKQYTQYLIQKGLKGSTINLYLKVVKVFIKYCHQEEYGGFDTNSKKISFVKQEKPILPTFKPKDVKKMLEACGGNNFRDIRDKTILTLFFETGLRLSELLKIKETDIFEDYIIIYGKNRKQRMIPITPLVKKALFRYMRVRASYFEDRVLNEHLFLSYRGKRLTPSAVDKMIKERGKGIEGVRISPHTCRHFFAQQQIKMGTDIYTISRLLGHENITITQIYLNSLGDKDIVSIAKNNSVLMNM